MRTKLIPLLLCLAVPVLFLGQGCEDDSYNYQPPAGQGALIIDNNTGDHVEVFIDGVEQNKTKAGENRAYPHAPGVVRVVLSDTGTERTWRDDVDILEGRNTVIDLSVNVDDWTAFLVVTYVD